MGSPDANVEPGARPAAAGTLVYEAASDRPRAARGLAVVSFGFGAAAILCLVVAFAWFALRLNGPPSPYFRHYVLAWTSVVFGSVAALLAIVTLTTRGWGNWKVAAFAAAVGYWIVFAFVWFFA